MGAITPDVALNDTLTLYSSVPQYIQDWDESNNYQLLSWLDGVCSMLQPLDNLVRDGYDNNGVGYSLLFNYLYYYSGNLKGQNSSGLANIEDVNQALIVLPWLAQFVGTELPQIPNTVLAPKTVLTNYNIVSAIQPYINNWIELIVYSNSFQRGTPSSILYSLAGFLTNLNNFQNQTIVVSNPSASLSGESVTYSYTGQLPWGAGDYCTVYGFGQTNADDKVFNLNKVQVASVVQPSGSTPGTFTVLSQVSADASSTASGTAVRTISPAAFTLFEQTKIVNLAYVYDPYSIVILVPTKYFPSTQYKKVGSIGVFDYTKLYSYYEPAPEGTGAAGYTTYMSYPNSLASASLFALLNIPAGLSYQIVTI